MLYDQAQLVTSYLDGYQLSGNDEFARIAKEILAYTIRDMRDPAGGFYSAEDADSDNPYEPGEHGEGAYYLWTREDIASRLDSQSKDIFFARYGVRDDGNVDQDPMKEFTGRNILYLAHPTSDVAAKFNQDKAQVEKMLAQSESILFEAREKRRRPHLDDKVITAWNGLMIGALSKGSRILNDPQLLEAAVKTANFIKTDLYDKESRTLYRRYRNEKAGLAGQLDDYSYLVHGLLILYETSQKPEWLRWAVDLTEKQIELFWNDKENFFFDSVADPSVIIRMRDKHDGAEPAGNSIAAHNLLRLGQLQNNPEYQKMARQLIESFSEVINKYPPSLPLMLTAWQQLNTKPTQVVIAGERGAEDTARLLHIIDKNFDPSRLVLLADGAENQKYLAQRLPFLETATPINGKATAYVCRDFICKMPVNDPLALAQQLREHQ